MGPSQGGPGLAFGLGSQSRRTQRGPATPRVKDATVTDGPKEHRGPTGWADSQGSLAPARVGERGHSSRVGRREEPGPTAGQQAREGAVLRAKRFDPAPAPGTETPPREKDATFR